VVADLTRQIASDISVISIALMAITFVLISLAWKGINNALLEVEPSTRIEILKKGVIALIPFIVLLGILVHVGSRANNINEFTTYSFYALIGLVGFIILVVILGKLIKFIPFSLKSSLKL
jgi:TRAP-type mannitol/chloroaromatic compound transport system permease large subunit